MADGSRITNSLGGLAEQSLFRQQAATTAQARSLSALDALRAGNRGTSPEETRQALREASKQFEAVFLHQVLQAMRQTVGDGGLIERSQGEEIFQGMLDEEWSKSLAGRHGSRGLSEMLYRQLARQMGLEDQVEERAPTPPSGAAPLSAPGGAQAHPLMALTALPPMLLRDEPGDE